MAKASVSTFRFQQSLIQFYHTRFRCICSKKTFVGISNCIQKVFSCSRNIQSHYEEVPRREIFMEQELNFGLDFGQLALLKKNWPIMSNFYAGVFMGKKMSKLIKKHCSVCTKK